MEKNCFFFKSRTFQTLKGTMSQISQTEFNDVMESVKDMH